VHPDQLTEWSDYYIGGIESADKMCWLG